jgi:hypothetical protein
MGGLIGRCSGHGSAVRSLSAGRANSARRRRHDKALSCLSGGSEHSRQPFALLRVCGRVQSLVTFVTNTTELVQYSAVARLLSTLQTVIRVVAFGIALQFQLELPPVGDGAAAAPRFVAGVGRWLRPLATSKKCLHVAMATRGICRLPSIHLGPPCGRDLDVVRAVAHRSGARCCASLIWARHGQGLVSPIPADLN